MKISDLKAGDVIIADGGFTCMPAGKCTVKSDRSGELYIDCAGPDAHEGTVFTFRNMTDKHYLAGQEGDDGELIGLSLPVAGDKS